MILTDDFNRVIFWGTKIDGNFVNCDLAFLASSLSREIVQLKSQDKKNKVKIRLESKYLNSNFPFKLINAQFEVFG